MTVAFLMAIVAAAIAVVRGGSLERLGATRFRWLPLLFGALALQLVFALWEPGWLSEAGALAVVLGSIVGVAVFLTINGHLPGTLLAALGLSLNVLVIGLNGAMPVSSEAARIAGTDPPEIGGIKHELMTEDTELHLLGDVIPIPRWSVISIGDVILAAGLARLTYHQTRHGPVPPAPGTSGETPRSGGGASRGRSGRRARRRDARAGGSSPGAPPAPPPSPRRPG